jgi:hypothetical protein
MDAVSTIRNPRTCHVVVTGIRSLMIPNKTFENTKKLKFFIMTVEIKISFTKELRAD